MADHYKVEVNKGELSVRSYEGDLNKKWDDGWALHTAFVQDGNTVTIWNRRQ
jgi:hypothetical protein